MERKGRPSSEGRASSRSALYWRINDELNLAASGLRRDGHSSFGIEEREGFSDPGQSYPDLAAFCIGIRHEREGHLLDLEPILCRELNLPNLSGWSAGLGVAQELRSTGCEFQTHLITLDHRTSRIDELLARYGEPRPEDFWEREALTVVVELQHLDVWPAERARGERVPGVEDHRRVVAISA